MGEAFHWNAKSGEVLWPKGSPSSRLRARISQPRDRGLPTGVPGSRGASGRAPIRDSYGYSLRGVLLPWCQREGVLSAAGIDTRTLERFAAELRERTTREGNPLSGRDPGLTSRPRIPSWPGTPRSTTHGTEDQLHHPLGGRLTCWTATRSATSSDRRSRCATGVMVRAPGRHGHTPRRALSLSPAPTSDSSGPAAFRGARQDRRARRPGHRRVVRPLRAPRCMAMIEPVFVSLRKDRRTGEHEPLTVNGVQSSAPRHGVNAGLRSAISPYTFRHSACRWMLLAGFSTVVVEAIMGHGSAEMIRQPLQPARRRRRARSTPGADPGGAVSVGFAEAVSEKPHEIPPQLALWPRSASDELRAITGGWTLNSWLRDSGGDPPRAAALAAHLPRVPATPRAERGAVAHHNSSASAFTPARRFRMGRRRNSRDRRAADRGNTTHQTQPEESQVGARQPGGLFQLRGRPPTGGENKSPRPRSRCR